MNDNTENRRVSMNLAARCASVCGCYAFCVAALLCLEARASETEPPLPPAVLVGGEHAAAKIKSISSSGEIDFETPSGDRTVASDDLVRWGHRVEAAGSRLIVLAEGSEIAAMEWTAGRSDETLKLDGETLAFTPSLFESVSLPRHMVRAVALKLPIDLRARDSLLEQVRDHDAPDDAVLLAGGDRLTGRVTKIDLKHVSIETSLGPVEAPLEGVDAVLFDTPLVERPPTAPLRMLVGLVDGSLITVREIDGDGDNLILKLEGDVVLRGGAKDSIASLQPLGNHALYLSDVEPHSFAHVPYLDLKWPLGRDKNALGGRLRAGGKVFTKGLGVHSAARLVYRLDGTRKHFAALAAIDDSAAGRGSAVFRVLLAQGDTWREAFTSPVIRGGDEPLPIFVPLEGARGLALVVDYADRGDELDHADWLDARLE
jgi:hypothetical protein